jgi:hypothetical protein
MPMKTSDIDEDLVRLEIDIRQLKIQYEQYFGGGKKRPPKDVEWRIEQTAKRYGDRGAEMNYGQRFRFGNLIQTYSKYRDIFHKRAQRDEEGLVPRHFGAAAKAVAAERARAAKVERSSVGAVAVVCSDPADQPKKVAQLYQAFRDALNRSGEGGDKVSREKFTKFLQQKAADLQKQKGAAHIEFIVSVESGKARLKARVKV